MREKSYVAVVALWFLIYTAAATSATKNIHAAKREANSPRTLFPGPVTPEKSCIQNAGSPQEPQDMRAQFRQLWSARESVSADRRVLLLQYAERLVRNRAYFLTLALQMQSPFGEFQYQPGFLYYYASAAASLVTAPDAMVSSGVFFDSDTHYPNWYRTVWFNATMPRFAPRATRQSRPELRVDDYGTNVTRDYTSQVRQLESVPNVMVHTFQRQNKFGDVTDASILGIPERSGLETSDVYYDCVHGNRWLTTLAFPAMERLPRYTAYFELRKLRYVADVTADVDVAQLVAGWRPEVPGFHNMLALMTSCPAPPPDPPVQDPRDLPASFFRSVYPQSRLALRLAHSLSAFLQILPPVTEELDYAGNGITYSPYDPYPNTASAKIKADVPMNDTLLEAEVLANVMADPRILASGVFFTTERATDSAGLPHSTPRKAFQAWRGTRGLVVADLSTSSDPNPQLTSRAEIVWKNADVDPKIQTFTFHAGVRSSKLGGDLADFAIDPLEYRATPLAEGYWTAPYYKCDGRVDQWVVTYAAPFFGPSVAEAEKLILRGTVTVDVTVTAENWQAS
ncbi:hypothetical protein ACOMHN_060090 [Nucella lapillus]